MAYAALFQGRAAPAHLDTVKQLLIKLADASRREPGTIRYEFYQFKDDPATFLLFGIWVDEAAWQAHMLAEAHDRYVASLPADVFEIPPQQTHLEVLDALL